MDEIILFCIYCIEIFFKCQNYLLKDITLWDYYYVRYDNGARLY